MHGTKNINISWEPGASFRDKLANIFFQKYDEIQIFEYSKKPKWHL